MITGVFRDSTVPDKGEKPPMTSLIGVWLENSNPQRAVQQQQRTDPLKDTAGRYGGSPQKQSPPNSEMTAQIS